MVQIPAKSKYCLDRPTEVNQMPQNPPRILLVLGMLWGENGITSHLHTLGKGLLANGCEVALATGLAQGVDGATEESELAIQRLTASGIQYFPMQFPSGGVSWSSLAMTLRTMHRIDEICRTFRPDVIHLHALSTSPFVQLVRLRYGIPVVSTCHMEPASQRLSIKLANRLNQLTGSLFGSRAIAISSTLEQAYAQVMRVPPPHIRKIYHGIDAGHYRPPSIAERQQARQIYGLTETDRVICLIGRLESKKGHSLLFEAVAQLKADHLYPVVLCAGKGYGDEMATVMQQAQDAGIAEQVRLLGFTDTRQVLWASEIATLPSAEYSEAFPLVIPEAMLCGVVPIRTPAAGATDQIQDQINGYIVPFDDPTALAGRLKQLLSDHSLLNQMSASSTERAQKYFTVERMVIKTLDVYQEVMR
ncbi:MAG: hypothetical protein RLZZ511_1498 [Cyanobacteriota bacterium]|jgi:glycosyltransferase involved in cell wall biosynthesis